MQGRISFVGFDNAIKKLGANDATAAPNGGDVAEVQIPFVLRAGGSQPILDA